MWRVIKNILNLSGLNGLGVFDMCVIKRPAKKYMKLINKKELRRVKALIDKIEANPYGFELLNSKQRKARFGKNRIIYSIVGGIVIIDNIGNRETVYKFI